MNRSSRGPLLAAVAAIGLASALVACHDSSSAPHVVQTVSPFVETKLVADAAGAGAAIVDANLVNPWGIVFNATSILWVSNNQSGTSTLYDTAGVKAAVVVAIPSHAGASGGKPTGVVFNTTTGFVIPGGVAAHFIFAATDGTITAWSSGATAVVVADRSANGAEYTGLAMAANGAANFLYAANFRRNTVDVFDATYTFVSSFTDSTIAAGYAPFGIQNIGGQLYVTFAKRLAADSTRDEPGAGNGFVDVFSPNGTRTKRLASNGSLNAPWGVALAPTSFGLFGGDVLVGNFGDGRIGAYSPADGSFAGFVGDTTSTQLVIDGLWGLAFGPGTAGGKLYFSSGPSGETHGLVGMLTPKP